MPKLKAPAAGGVPATPESILEIENLELHYGRKAAFTQIDMRIRPGLVTAFVGPSGCGKSSFLMALNRLSDLVPSCKVSGSVRFTAKRSWAAT